jgi:5-methyltetrahydrofolate--homocysteine methyltransferase
MEGPLDRIRAGEVLVGDGAWGTQLMARGLQPGDSPEALNRSNPEILAEVARLYVDAGADFITTNTFGGSPLNLASYGLEDDVEELNRLAVEAIRPVVDGRAAILASVGPTGKILSPYGDTEPEAMAEAFRRQIKALADAGVGVICVETMIDLREAVLAVEAAREFAPETPVFATMTFDLTPRGAFTTMGVSVEQACGGLTDAGADAVGSNCGNGVDAMLEIAGEFANHTDLPIVIQSNAGLPEHLDGELSYPESPEFMASRVDQLIGLGVKVVGGCCGTGPEHIRAIRSAVDAHRCPDGGS